MPDKRIVNRADEVRLMYVYTTIVSWIIISKKKKCREQIRYAFRWYDRCHRHASHRVNTRAPHEIWWPKDTQSLFVCAKQQRQQRRQKKSESPKNQLVDKDIRNNQVFGYALQHYIYTVAISSDDTIHNNKRASQTAIDAIDDCMPVGCACALCVCVYLCADEWQWFRGRMPSHTKFLSIACCVWGECFMTTEYGSFFLFASLFLGRIRIGYQQQLFDSAFRLYARTIIWWWWDGDDGVIYAIHAHTTERLYMDLEAQRSRQIDMLSIVALLLLIVNSTWFYQSFFPAKRIIKFDENHQINNKQAATASDGSATLETIECLLLLTDTLLLWTNTPIGL